MIDRRVCQSFQGTRNYISTSDKFFDGLLILDPTFYDCHLFKLHRPFLLSKDVVEHLLNLVGIAREQSDIVTSLKSALHSELAGLTSSTKDGNHLARRHRHLSCRSESSNKSL